MYQEDALDKLEELYDVINRSSNSSLTGRTLTADEMSSFLPAVEYALKIIKSVTRFNIKDEVWPQNLLLEIGFVVKDSDLPVLEPRLLDVLSTLTEKEKDVLIKRFKNGMTLQEIGDTRGVTREHTRQIEAHALRKLRHPSRRRLVAAGELDLANYDAICQKVKEATADLNKELTHILQTTDGLRNGKTMKEMQKDLKELEISTPYDIKIIDLELSVRTYNCLVRSGYKTLGDLVGMNKSDFYKVRNLGKRSLDEIVDKLSEYGIAVAE